MTDEEFRAIALSAKAAVALEHAVWEDGYSQALEMVLGTHREVVAFAMKEGQSIPLGERASGGHECGVLELLAHAVGSSYRCSCELSYDKWTDLFVASYTGTDLEAYVARATLDALEHVAWRAARRITLAGCPPKSMRVSRSKVPARLRLIVDDLCMSLSEQAMAMGAMGRASEGELAFRVADSGLADRISESFGALGRSPRAVELHQCVDVAVHGCALMATALAEGSADLEDEVTANELGSLVDEADEWCLDLARWVASTLDCAVITRPRPDRTTVRQAVFFVGLRHDVQVAAPMCEAMVRVVRAEVRRAGQDELGWRRAETVGCCCCKMLSDARAHHARRSLPAVREVIDEVESILESL